MKAAIQLLQIVKAQIPPPVFYRIELPKMPLPKVHGWGDGGLCAFHPDQRGGKLPR
jgi:hypothetical protein